MLITYKGYKIGKSHIKINCNILDLYIFIELELEIFNLNCTLHHSKTTQNYYIIIKSKAYNVRKKRVKWIKY